MIPNYRYTVREISGVSFKGMVVVGSSLDDFLQHNGNPDNLFLHDARLLKSSESTSNALVHLSAASAEISQEEVFVKEFRFKNTLHSLKPLFRRHHAQVIWRVSWHLLQHHIAVPEPIGYLLKHKGPFCLNGYYFSKAVPDCTNLGKLAVNQEHLRKRLESESLTETLARDIASLHNCGVIHGDLKWTNILVHLKQNMLWFVDLDSAKMSGGSPGPAHVARDLARFVLNGLEVGLDYSIIDRFLAKYAENRKFPRGSIDGPMNRAFARLRKRHEGRGSR
jgi:hypothetical protein